MTNRIDLLGASVIKLRTNTMYMKNSKYYFFISLIIAFSIFLRFFLLTNQSLWLDEGWSLILSDGRSFQENLAKILGKESGDKYQPLYYLILFYWRSTFGDSEFAVRSLSAILGIGSVITLFFTVLRIYGKNHAVLSFLLLTFSSFNIYYSQEARPYSLLIFLTSLQLYFFSKALKEEESNEFLSKCFFCLCTAIGLCGSILIGIFSLALSLSHLIVYKKLKHWLKWWIPAAVFSLPMIFFYLLSPAAADPKNTLVTSSGLPIVQNIAFVLYGLLVGTTYGPPIEKLRGDDKIQVLLNYLPQIFLLFLVTSIVFLALVIVLWKSPRGNKYQRADYFFATLLVVSFVLAFIFAAATKINWLPRHSFYLYLPLAIIFPSTLNQGGRLKTLRTKLKTVTQSAKFAIIFLIIINIYSLSNYYFDKDYRKDDYRSVVKYLLDNRGYSDKSVLLSGTPRLMSYYGDTLTLDGGNIKKQTFAEQLRDLTKDSDTVFLVINRELFWKKYNDNSVQGVMSDLYVMQSKVSFPYFNIYRFVKK